MSGSQIAFLPHDCGSKKGLKVFAQPDGTLNGWCFACNTFVPDPYGDGRAVGDVEIPKKKSEQELQEELAEVDGYQVLSIPERKLKSSVLNYFGAKVSVSEFDGKTPTAIYWPVTKEDKRVGYYVKVLKEGANPFFLGYTKGCDFIGWEQAKKHSAYRLIVTEGPEDMAAVRQAYELYGKEEFMPAIISLPRGAGSAKRLFQTHLSTLTSMFKEIVLCFDNDEAGQKAVEDSMLILPPDTKSVILPYKDANECILQGATKQMYSMLAFKASIPKNTRLVYAEALHEAAREPAKYGEYTWPFPTMNELTRAIRTGESTYIGAAPKMGKGELRNELAAHQIKKHDAKIFIASPEENNKKTYKLLAGKLESRIFHDPKIEFDYDAYDRAGEKLKEHAVFLDLYQHMGWESLRKDIIHAATWGAKLHFIDPITNLTNGMDAGPANSKLQEIAQDIAALAMDHDIHIFLFCHLKAHDGNISPDVREKKYKSGHYIGLGNCSHDFGGDVYPEQFAGSRAMARSCNMMIGLEGNKDPNLPDEIKNIRRLKILEDREFGVTGSVDVFWDKNTGRFTEC